MQRPLTAADRRPEKDDRLADGMPSYYCLPAVVHVEQVRGDVPYFWGYNVNCGHSGTQSVGVPGTCFREWHYVSRADNGPITTEAPDATQEGEG